jgi:UTP--glucose-1-phosphate uridylyltransferase
MGATVRKAVFPVAGLGTRFLPATKANPKEMLTVVDKPLIQYAVDEVVAAGVTELIFITGQTKRAIEDHFDKARELEGTLQATGKYKLLSAVREILPSRVSCMYIRQPEPLGLGHAVLCAKPVIGDEPFAVVLADDLIDGWENGCTSQMVDVYQRHRSSVLAVQAVSPNETDRYGVVVVDSIEKRLGAVSRIVEKPAPSLAPSKLGVVGRYVLTPTIFEILERTQRGAGGEIQLTDGIARLLEREQVLAYQFTGQRYDCGSKLGYLKANVAYAMKHPELREEFSAYLQQLVGVPAPTKTLNSNVMMV